VSLPVEHADLEEFPLRFPDGELYAVEKEGGVYLTGPEFERLAGAEQVREHARGAVEEMAAVISLLWLPFRKPSVGHVQREDDQGGGCFSAMSQSARQEQDHNNDDDDQPDTARCPAVAVMPRTVAGSSNECEDDENNY
jgi:hypothetical protein